MKRFFQDMGIALIMGLILPALLLGTVLTLTSHRTEIPIATEQNPETQSSAEPHTVSLLVDDEHVTQMPMQEYLTCVLLAEMPVSFEEEALKAQSVVARTYTIRALEGASKHTSADVCADSSCCQGYLSVESFLARGGREEDAAHIRQVVASTAEQVLTYEGNLIEATYFSCSGGTTEDAVAVWGTDVPYLQSVSSPGEEYASHYQDTVTFSADDFAEKLGENLTGNPAGWFGQATYTKGGGVAQMEIGGRAYEGTELRSLLGLRSTAFEIEVDGNAITVTTRGYGHRVGMSQYGANAMAAAGSGYPEILAHYYHGTELTHYTN